MVTSRPFPVTESTPNSSELASPSTQESSLSTARRTISAVTGLCLLAGTSGAVVARYLPIPDHRTLYAAIASPFLVPAGLLAILVFAWGRRWAMAAIACCAALALVVPQIPWYVSAEPAREGARVRAVTVNMLFGKADPQATVELASSSADVVMLQELTPDAVDGITAAGIGRAFPYRAVEAREGAAGAGIYSRYPLTRVETVPGFEMPMVKAALRPPGTDTDVTVVSMHLAAPWPQPIDGWHNDFTLFPQVLADLARQTGSGPTLIGGDFNATTDMRPYRDLLTNGYRDAAEQSGTGRDLTYPANRRIPPLMGIDHFITRNCTAIATHTVDIAGTDHRALVTTVVLAPAGGSA